MIFTPKTNQSLEACEKHPFGGRSALYLGSFRNPEFMKENHGKPAVNRNIIESDFVNFYCRRLPAKFNYRYTEGIFIAETVC